MNVTISIALGIVVALVGSGGIVFGALRFNREEASKLVQDHAAILKDMATLNDELRQALERTRLERDEVSAEVVRLREQTRLLTEEATYLRDEVSAAREEVTALREQLEARDATG